MENIRTLFSVLPDPRAKNARHDLSELLFIALAAALSGAKSCAEMALFGELHTKVLQEILVLKHGTPSHDTFSKVFRWLDPQAFEASFRHFMAAFAQALGGEKIISVDGKALRRAYEKGKAHAPQVMVTAWGAELRLVLGCQAAPEGNEVKAVLDLLALVDIKGALITADALHCRKDTAALIKEKGGDYVVAIKGNQPDLLRLAASLTAPADEEAFAETKQKAHGRYEERRASVSIVPPRQANEFPGLKAIGKITSLREKNGLKEPATRFYALSCVLSPEQLLHVVRAHWTIKNQQHWILDVVLDEDLARNRRNHGARNLAVLRRLALNILHSEKSPIPLSHKMRLADWDTSFLFNLLGHMR